MATTASPQLILPPEASMLHGTSEGQPMTHMLSKVVRRILGRVTPQNYEAMKKELFDQPIRQSTDEEIADAVHLVYIQAVRPEAEADAELYAHLVSDLVKHAGGKGQGAGEKIRYAIIDKCQEQFENPFRLADDELVDAGGTPLPQAALDELEVRLKAQLRASVNFLGHLLLVDMVNEMVVNYVLFHLLYGDQEEVTKKPRPEDYELEIFADLLRTVAKSLGPGTLNDYIPGYMTSLKRLMPRVTDRTKLKLRDLLELYENHWEETSSVAPDRTADSTGQRACEQQEVERTARAEVSSPET